jgi:sugar lactone lactonase YvrE
MAHNFTTLAPISLSQLSWHGQGLVRPECVLTFPDGSLATADWRSGVARTHGAQSTLITGKISAERALRPNGIAAWKNGGFLLADLGERSGGVYELSRDGQVLPFLETVEGEPLPPTNFVYVDAWKRVWITVSTRKIPRAAAYRSDVSDGFIVLVDERGARVVADGLGYTNEVLVSPDGQFLYVNETFARRLSRFRICPGNVLRDKTVTTHFSAGEFPDGLGMDSEGALWVVSIISNRVIRVLPDGSQHIMLQDCPAQHAQWVETAFQQHALARPHLDRHPAKTLRNISSIAFGGDDLRTVYFGCLLGQHIASARIPISGSKPPHW